MPAGSYKNKFKVECKNKKKSVRVFLKPVYNHFLYYPVALFCDVCNVCTANPPIQHPNLLT